ncbi:hypothetical protein ACFQ0K_02620 [Nocardioides caeni]|uniref:Uncharacterized protein n=1 Tax=Nocardioides caeni TaxID=574700 RepID=A0A4S8NSJ1_9ACTN|nr:hypothetical protein [Nocardioides caeni]THV18279.1 hypothetical protein E9934_01175 [Nocardioides caeni]
MENITMNPMTIPSCWQLALSACDQATFALATLEVQGIAVRPMTDVARATFAFDAVAATDVKRERAATGTDHDGTINAAVAVPGIAAWSPPN